MLNKLIARSVGIVFLAGFAFAACGEAAPSTPQAKYCTQVCDCNKCSDSERASCLDDAVNLQDDAQNRGCRDSYDTYLACVTKDASCDDGLYDESACFNEETDLNNCISPPPMCASTNDGICDEPAPVGNGKCAKGSDKADCATPPCPTTNNGVCDEPKGTNTCALGTDPVDCAPMPCPYANDGTCDEPGGTGACDEGTDSADCYCPTANNGICDEPQGTAKCAAGTDTDDCTPRVSCGEFVAGPNAGMGKLCPSSQPLFDAFEACLCAGACTSSCSSNFCVNVQDISFDCANCASASCSGPQNACLGSPP